MIKLVVIADDFTGALDTGVQFSKQGVPTIVTSNKQLFLENLRDKAEVLVVDIESRHCGAKSAYKRVERVAKTVAAFGVEYFYKKTDSTLRGNIGAELTALLDACGGDCLAFIPAFPKNLRTTKNGIQYVEGLEINKTVFAHDPFEPVKHSSVAEIIRQQTELLTEIITADRYHLANKACDKKTIRIFDAQTDDDLRRLGGILKELNRLHILAGCAGFAETLPELLNLRAEKLHWNKNSNNVLFVTGSVNQITIDQMRYAKKLGYYSVTLSPEQKLDRTFPGSYQCNQFVQMISDALKRHNKVIIESVGSREQIFLSDQYATVNGIPQENVRQSIADNMGEITAQIMEKVQVGNLAVFGGDTLYSIMEKIKCKGVIPILEISPGVVVARAIVQNRCFNIITKSGGFGEKNIVETINEFIFNQPQ